MSRLIYDRPYIVLFQVPDLEAVGLTDLIETLISQTYVPNRDADGPFIFSVDHCFSIRGQGTIMTGTALNGSAAVNDVRHDFGLCMHVQNCNKCGQTFKELYLEL